MDTENSLSKSTTRRKFVLGSALAGMSAVLGGKNLLTQSPKHPQSEKPTPQPEKPQQQETPAPARTPESLSLPNDETVENLSSVYEESAQTMDSESFPTKEDSTSFFRKIEEIAAEVEPGNKNLTHQILSVVNFQTDGSFDARSSKHEVGEVGLFGLTPQNCEELQVEAADVLHMMPLEQAELFKLLLQKRKKSGSDESRHFASVSDIWLARSYEGSIGVSAKDILFSKGTDSYDHYQMFDCRKSYEITKGDVDEVIISKALEKGEQLESLMDLSRRTHSLDTLRIEDKKSNSETEADLETATYLLKLYGDFMDDSFYQDESHVHSQERKLLFFKELTRSAFRLNPENNNLANQISAAMFYESDKSFSSYKLNPTSFATGLIQFMPETAHDMNTSIVRLAQLTPIEQLYYVEAFLKDKGDLWDISDVYMAIFYPRAVGEDLDFVIGDENGNDEQRIIWKQNQSLVEETDSAVITKDSATQQILKIACNNGEKEEYLRYPLNYSPST